jgi:hypothetical protein
MNTTNRIAEFFQQIETDLSPQMMDRRPAPGHHGAHRPDPPAPKVPVHSLPIGLETIPQDASFRRIRAELLREFGPCSANDHVIIDALAGDYMRLSQLARMTVVSVEPYLPPRLKTEWHYYRRARRGFRISRRVIQRLKSGELPACTPAEANWLAREIALDVSDLLADLTEVPVEPSDQTHADLPDLEKCEFELEDERRLEHLLKTVAPSAERLRDLRYVAGLLNGQRPSHADDLTHIRAILERHMRWWRLSMRSLRRAKLEVRAIYAAAEIAARPAPKDQLRIQQCQRQITRSIKQKRKQLRERQDDRLRTHTGSDSPPAASNE